MNKPKIGWIGLGKMGHPMSLQLLKAGYIVSVYNRSKEKGKPLEEQGALLFSSPSELIQHAEVVFVMVSDDQATQEVFSGTSGLLSTSVSDKIIINMSTVSPKISKKMADLCAQQGNHYLDAPVSGSVKQAETGQLVIMVGGKYAIFEQVKPILEALGKMAMWVGDTGAGNSAKIAINTLLAIQAQGLAEAVLFAQQNNIKTEDFFTLINASALGNAFGKIKGEAIVSENYNAAFALKHIAKDLRLAKDGGLDSPLGNLTHQTFQQAESTLGEEDIIAILKYIHCT